MAVEGREFEAELWQWEARPESGDGWVFVTLPEELTEEIRLTSGAPRGFGSVRVEVTIGSQTWRTSVFPDAERGFCLPLKKPVRRAEGLDVGDVATVALTVLDG